MRGMHLNASETGTFDHTGAAHKTLDHHIYIVLSHLNWLAKLAARQTKLNA
jgi:hypothetical protein